MHEEIILLLPLLVLLTVGEGVVIVLLSKQPWQNSLSGWTFMAVAVGLALTGAHFTLATFMGSGYPGSFTIRFMCLLILSWASWSRVVIMRRLTRAYRASLSMEKGE